jgi:dCTP deaminase
MLLQREALREAVKASTPRHSRLIVTPLLDPKQIGPASIDLRLGSDFFVLRRAQGPGLDPGTDDQAEVEALQERVRVPLGEPFWLHPQQFALGATLEYLRMPPHLAAYVLGRSSWGRVGLLVATAVMVQPGYTGTLTFELVNEGDSPIALYPGLRVAQLAVHTLEAETNEPYNLSGPKYSSPTGPQATRLAWDRAEIEKVRNLNARLTRLVPRGPTIPPAT